MQCPYPAVSEKKYRRDRECLVRGSCFFVTREIHRERKTYIEAGETSFPEEKNRITEKDTDVLWKMEERKTIKPKTDIPGKKKKHC